MTFSVIPNLIWNPACPQVAGRGQEKRTIILMDPESSSG